MTAEGSSAYQYIAGFCVNIISISYGGFCVWPSASFLVLQSEDSPLETGPMSDNDAGNVGAMLCVGGAVGTIFFSWCVDRIGRKRSLILLALPSLIGWLIIPFARNPIHLCISRFFGGIGGGGAFCVIPMYLTELAEDRIRGILGTFLILSANFGIVLAFILGYYFHYSTVAWILFGFALVYLIPLIFLPESPQHLIRKKKIKKAEMALRYFRNVHTVDSDQASQLQAEMEKLKGTQNSDVEGEASIRQILTNRVNRKAVLIGIMLVWLNQFSGQFGMISYTATIFKQAGSDISPKMAAIIVGVIQLVGSYAATTLVDRSGRKVLLTISCIGATVGYVCLATYSYLDVLGVDLQNFRWVAVTSFSFVFFITCWGVVPLPFLIISEIMPSEMRSLGSMICMVSLWCFAFVLLKTLPLMSSALGLHGLAVFFGSCCLIGALLVLLLPETKGKSIAEITKML